jgi:probable phosphoglycerate mutase
VTIFYLVRHAIHDLVDKCLAGRTDVSLNEEGRRQALVVAEQLMGCGITAVQSSPRLRARETAQAIGVRLGLPVQSAPDMDEIDLGEWTGRSFAELDDDPLWKLWNAARAVAEPPGGETADEMQRRVVAHLTGAAAANPAGRIVIVSHAEPIRAILLKTHGVSLDEWWRITVEPASIKTVTVEGNRIVATGRSRQRDLSSRGATPDHASAGA